MNVLVIGAGMMGSALAYDLVNSGPIRHVLVADINGERASEVASKLGSKAEAVQIDIHDFDEVIELMRRANGVIGATSYSHNLLLTKAAIEAGVHFCDLGGNMDMVYRQMELNDLARRSGVLIVPNCGLAPGMACAIAAGAALKFSPPEKIHIRVGGLPQRPLPPLNYQLVFSPEGLINEYIEPSEVIRNGTVQTVESMGDLEQLSFPHPFERLEAFSTSGGISTLTRMFTGVREMDYKTIRYPGHCEKFKLLLDLGFAGSEPVSAGSALRTPRELFEELLRRKLPVNQPDVVLMRVTVTGRMDGERRVLNYDMIDYSDQTTNHTSMMRTTAFPTSVIAQLILSGSISSRGVLPPEQCVPLDPFLTQLKKRNIIIHESLTTISGQP